MLKLNQMWLEPIHLQRWFQTGSRIRVVIQSKCQHAFTQYITCTSTIYVHLAWRGLLPRQLVGVPMERGSWTTVWDGQSQLCFSSEIMGYCAYMRNRESRSEAPECERVNLHYGYTFIDPDCPRTFNPAVVLNTPLYTHMYV